MSAWLDSNDACRLVHRLDKDASGCLVIARTADSAAWLSLAFAQHAKSAADADSVHTGTLPCIRTPKVLMANCICPYVSVLSLAYATTSDS